MPKTLTQSVVSQRSLTARFLHLLGQEIWKTVWDRTIDGLMFLAALIYTLVAGKLSAQAWRNNTLDALVPFIFAACAMAIVHLVRTGILLAKEVQLENASAEPVKRNSGLLRADGSLDEHWELPPTISHYRSRILILVISLSVVPIGVAYCSWRAATPLVSKSDGPKIRITRLIPDVVVNKPISLRVHYIHDGENSIGVYSQYIFRWVETLPIDMNAENDLEDSVWNSMGSLKPVSIPGTTSTGEKTLLTVPPKMEMQVIGFTNLVATPGVLEKLNSNSAIYFAGIMTDTEGNKAAEFCARIDKYRDRMITLCRSHN